MTTAAEYLKKPYGRLLVPEDEGGYRAEILEFPGCFAEGDTAAEAADNLESAALSWLASALAKGQTIPEPMEELDYSGKLVVRLPRSLHRRAALAANREGVSLNQFIVTSVAEQVGIRSRTPMIYTFGIQFAVGGAVTVPIGDYIHSSVMGQTVTSAAGPFIGLPVQTRKREELNA